MSEGASESSAITFSVGEFKLSDPSLFKLLSSLDVWPSLTFLTKSLPLRWKSIISSSRSSSHIHLPHLSDILTSSQAIYQSALWRQESKVSREKESLQLYLLRGHQSNYSPLWHPFWRQSTSIPIIMKSYQLGHLLSHTYLLGSRFELDLAYLVQESHFIGWRLSDDWRAWFFFLNFNTMGKMRRWDTLSAKERWFEQACVFLWGRL